MIDEYTKLPYIGKKRAKKLQSHGIGLEEIAQMDELTLKKHIPRISTSKLKVIIATARDIVGRMKQIEEELKIDRHKAKVLALNGYDIQKVANSSKKELMKMLSISEDEAFDIIFRASIKTGVKRADVKVKEEISSTGVLSSEGFVNGFGSGWKEIKIAEKTKKFRIVPFLIVIILIVSGISVSFMMFNPGLKIDGNLSDWNSVGGLEYGNLSYKYRLIGNTLYFLIEKDNIFSTVDSFYIAVDDGKGGYWIDGIHAHYVAEFYGWNSTLRGAHLWKYESGNDSWNFTIGAGMSYAVASYGIEGTISGVSQSSKLIFMEKVKNRVVVKTAPLPAAGYCAQVVETTPHEILKNDTSAIILNITSPSFFVLNTISFHISGANLSNGYVLVNDYRYTVSPGNPAVAHINSNIRNAIVALYGNFTGVSGHVVSINATVGSGNMHFSYIHATAKMYLFKAPSKVRIDGAFGDWKNENVHPDIIGDVQDSNIDLVEYASTPHLGNVYMQVRGEFMGGTDIPIVRAWHFKDSDHDGVPDCLDPYPHDFNNDGIPDNESKIMYNGQEVPDVDGDGIADYPYGPDMWLNTTIPADFPKPYAGRHVSLYIGPPPPVKPKNGNDTAEIYFGSGAGAHLSWVPFPVKYKITITGRDGVFNATEYEFSAGKWLFRGYVKNIAAGYHRVELATGLNISHGKMWITVFSWNNERDMPSVVKRATRSAAETNVFYFHADINGNPGNMDWNVYSSKKTVELEIPSNRQWAQDSVKWVYQSPVSERYYITDAKVSFYVSDYSTWSDEYLNISLVGFDSSGAMHLVAYHNDTDIDNTLNTNPNKIPPYTLTVVRKYIEKGETIGLIFTYGSSQGGDKYDYIDIDYNSSAPYDSNITITTNTTIQVHSIWTENSSGAVVDTFAKGDTVNIFANVTDPLGADHINYTTVSVNAPLNGVLLSGSNMSEQSSGFGYKIFEFSVALNGISYSFGTYVLTGKYPISVTATDKEGNTNTNDSGAFYIPSDLAIKWNKFMFVPTGNYHQWYFHYVFNYYGSGDELVNLEFNSSALPNYDVMLYIDENNNHEIDPGDTLIGVYEPGSGWTSLNGNYDRDNNGKPDVLVEKGTRVSIILQENLSLANPGDSEYFILRANSSTGHVPASTSAESEVVDSAFARQYKIKTLYLKGTDGAPDYLNPITPVDNTQKSVNIGKDSSFTWKMNDSFATNFNIAGDIYVKIFIGHGPKVPQVNISLSLDDGTYIGSTEFLANGDGGGAWYTIKITPEIPMIARGHSIYMKVYGYDALTVYYNSTLNNSRIEINTTSYIWVSGINTYNATSYAQQSNFRAGENILINASLREPFAAYDVKYVSAEIINPNGTSISNETMHLYDDKGWIELYTLTYTLPANATVGWYKIIVWAEESNGIVNFTTSYFEVKWNISISPHSNSTTGKIAYYNYTIWNNGSGVDIITFLQPWSNQTVNITLYIYSNGQMVPIAYSNTGQEWDAIASGNNYSGLPGIVLAPGSSARVIMRVELISAYGGEKANTTLNITEFMGLESDTYTITEVPVPEFHGAVFILVIAPMLIILRRKRRTV